MLKAFVENNRPIGKVWDPVSPSEICEIIVTLKNEKAPGEYGIVDEVYKAPPNWSAPILSSSQK